MTDRIVSVGDDLTIPSGVVVPAARVTDLLDVAASASQGAKADAALPAASLDTSVDALLADPGSATSAALSSTYATKAQGDKADSAVQPSELVNRTLLVSGLTRIYTTSRSFAGIAVAPDRRRGRVVIRNIGSNPFGVAVRATLTANYNVTWTGAETVQPGEEFYSDQVAGNFYVGPSADGVAIEYEAFAEAVI